MDRVHNGTWEFQAGAEASAGTAAAEGSSGALSDGYTVHVLSDGGTSATASKHLSSYQTKKWLVFSCLLKRRIPH